MSSLHMPGYLLRLLQQYLTITTNASLLVACVVGNEEFEPVLPPQCFNASNTIPQSPGLHLSSASHQVKHDLTLTPKGLEVRGTVAEQLAGVTCHDHAWYVMPLWIKHVKTETPTRSIRHVCVVWFPLSKLQQSQALPTTLCYNLVWAWAPLCSLLAWRHSHSWELRIWSENHFLWHEKPGRVMTFEMHL